MKVRDSIVEMTREATNDESMRAIISINKLHIQYSLPIALSAGLTNFLECHHIELPQYGDIAVVYAHLRCRCRCRPFHALNT